MSPVWACVAAALLWLLAAGADCAPSNFNYETTERQACGDKLADIMSLVCSGRGYNNPFRPEHSSTRRFRRQIVDECCRRSCNPALLELYCRAESVDPPTPSNIQIRKRSDNALESLEQQVQEVGSGELTSTQDPVTAQTIIIEPLRKVEWAPTSKKREGSYRLLNLLEPSQQMKNMHTSKNSLDKVTQNDTTEDLKQGEIPPLRHHKNHHHTRLFRGRKAKKGRNSSGEAKQTFQIGTVRPYFYRSSIYQGRFSSSLPTDTT